MTLRQWIDRGRTGLRAQVSGHRWRAVSVVLMLAAGGRAQTFERVSDKPCRGIALDKEPYWAALGDDVVTVNDKKGRHEEKLPDSLKGAGLSVGVFFGRDYRVRIAGTARTPKGNEVRYFRSLPGGLRPAPDELGPLGKPGAPGLVALLGTADPEIVCRPGQSCLIKTINGWAKASAPTGLERVGLSIGGGWGIAGKTFFKLEKDWRALPAGAWAKADDGFVRDERACVVEHDASRMHHFDGSAWHASASPVAGPRSLWGNAETLWVTGDGGAAAFSDGQFRTLKGAPKSVVQVLGRSASDVWLCGAEGVFHAR
jgi:hypothetical protein